MMKVSSLAVATLALFQTTFSFAGGWSQSGGQTFKDAQNPWFLQNTPEVTYCINIDHPGISATPDQIDRAITRAFGYWKNEFNLANHLDQMMYGSMNQILIDTQTFIKHDKCDGTEDIQFLFGYGSIYMRPDFQQVLDFLKDPKDFIGVSVRTDYDLVNLRAKGFVYFSSDIGDNKFSSGTDTLDAPFSHDGILYRIIAHELGHVFGLPHMGNIEVTAGNTFHIHSDLMSAQFPEWCVRKGVAGNIENQELEPFFLAPETITNCKVKPAALQWLGLDTSYKCLQIKFAYTGQDPALLYASTDANSPMVTIGRFADADLDARTDLQQAITIILNDQQKVVSVSNGIDYAAGPAIWSFAFESTLTLNSPNSRNTGDTRSISMRLGPKNYELLGIVNNKITLLLDQDSTGTDVKPAPKFSLFSKQHSSH